VAVAVELLVGCWNSSRSGAGAAEVGGCWRASLGFWWCRRTSTSVDRFRACCGGVGPQGGSCDAGHQYIGVLQVKCGGGVPVCGGGLAAGGGSSWADKQLVGCGVGDKQLVG